MQQELVEALNEVEQLVIRGTVELEEERQRQIRLREDLTSLTVEALTKLQQQYRTDLNRVLEEELKVLDDEDVDVQVLEQEASAEHNLSLAITTVVCASPQRIAAEHLSEHAADFQYIASHIDYTADRGVDQKFCLLQVYRYYHADLTVRYQSWSGCGQASAENRNQRHGEGLMTHLYTVVSEDDLIGVLQHGFVGNPEGPASKWLVLFSSPLQALHFSHGAPGSVEAFSADDPDDMQAPVWIRSHVLLLCQVVVSHVRQVTIDDATMKQLDSLQSLVSLATLATSSDPAHELSKEFIHTTMRLDQHEGDIYIKERERHLPNLLPQFAVLCSQRLVETRTPSGQLEARAIQPEELLAAFSRDVNEEIASHHNRIWKEVDPNSWVRKTQLQRESETLDREISAEKDRIGEEKEAQKRWLRSAR